MGKTKNNFLIGAFIIAASNIIIKIIGAIYKIPLDRYILKTEGMGIYSSSYIIYNTLFIISTAGIPVAISKLVSEALVLNKVKESRKILKIALSLLFTVGLSASLIMFFGAGLFSNFISAPSSKLTMMAMAPSLFFVALASCYRGFYQGQNNMFPTALSEVLEAVLKLIVGLSLAYIAMKIFKSPAYGSAGAILGITIGTFISFIFLFFYNKKKIKSLPKASPDEKTSSTKDILLKLIKLAVPVTLGVSVFTLTSVIDTAMVMNQLQGLGFSESLRTSLYGYLNRAITLFNLPPTVIAAIAISIVPAISSAIAIDNKEDARKNVMSALRITILFAMPCAAGLSALAKPVLQLLYNDPNHSFLLNIMGIAVLFVTLVQVGNAILQAHGRPWIPVINMLIGGVVKVVINLLLVSHREININGAPIGTTLCYFTVMALNLYNIKKIAGVKYDFKGFVFKPLVTGFATAISAYFAYYIVSNIFGNTVSVFIAIIIGGIFYLASALLIKAFPESDILLLPKGDKLSKILKKYKLL